MTELDRHKDALQVAIGALRELGLDYSHFTDKVEKRIAAILEPPPEFEEVKVVRWTSGNCMDVFETEESAADPRNACGPIVKLTGTIKRPVKRAVVKEVSVEAKIGALGDVIGVGLTSRPFLDHPESHGKTGKLIFQWTE